MTNIQSPPFNWHELDRDNFLSWLVIHAMVAMDPKGKRHEEISAATDKFNNVKLTMQINGIEVPAVEFMTNFHNQFQDLVRDTAEDIVKERSFELIQAKEIVDSVVDDAVRTIYERFEQMGLPIRRDEY